MRLKRIAVKNFRSIKDITVEVGNELAIVGGNGSGKSTILRALERFFGQSTTIELDDFFGRKTDQNIEIALTFSDFSKEERDRFQNKIFREEMTVVRVFEVDGGRVNGRY
jgi:predicted ATP-dependent endonuclease of OLD family